MHTEDLTFFRPDELSQEPKGLPSDYFNRIRLLFIRSEQPCLFIPIRSMQYQAVITKDEIIFVDSLGYAVRDGQGGRMIVLAWQFDLHSREDLSEMVPMRVVHYHKESADFQRRLLGEFRQAINLLHDRQLDAFKNHHPVNIVSLIR